jgi:type IV pilus assembly protein PilM
MLGRLANLFPRTDGGVAIELGSEKINVVELKKQGATTKLVHLCSAEAPAGAFEEGRIVNPPELAEAIVATLAEHKITAKKVTSAVPMRESIVRLIPLPAELDDREVRDMILNHEAALYLPYPRDEVDLDYQKIDTIVDEDGLDKMQVLLAATRREVTDSYIETFKLAGLSLQTLEIGTFAMLRTMKEQLRQFAPQEGVVLVDIEFDSTDISIVVNGIPQFTRTVAIGTQQLQEALSTAMNLPASRGAELLQDIIIPETPVSGFGTQDTVINPGMASMMRVLGELSEEIRRSIDFYASHNDNLKLEQLMLAGPGAGLGQLDIFLTQRVGIPATAIDPLASLGLDAELDLAYAQRPSLATILGLGLRAAA